MPAAAIRTGGVNYMASFIKDIEDIRQRATRKLEDGAVTQGYQLDRQQSIAF